MLLGCPLTVALLTWTAPPMESRRRVLAGAAAAITTGRVAHAIEPDVQLPLVALEPAMPALDKGHLQFFWLSHDRVSVRIR